MTIREHLAMLGDGFLKVDQYEVHGGIITGSDGADNTEIAMLDMTATDKTGHSHRLPLVMNADQAVDVSLRLIEVSKYVQATESRE